MEPASRRFKLRLARYKALAETVAAFVRERGAERPLDLLDVGAGRGRSPLYLAAEGVADRLRFHGIDLDPRWVAHLATLPRFRVAAADAERPLPFRGASFDVVLCEQVLEHVGRPAELAREIARVMRPGGMLVLGVPTFPPGAAHVRDACARAAERLLGVRRPHQQTFTRGRVERLVRDAGLSVEASRGFRVVSGGPFSPLEDLEGWYRLNRALGRALPGLCTEVQVVARS